MEKFYFKTNINCNSCKSAVTPSLDNEPRISKWDVDLESTDKILSVEGDNISSAEIIELITSTGYRAEKL